CSSLRLQLAGQRLAPRRFDWPLRNAQQPPSRERPVWIAELLFNADDRPAGPDPQQSVALLKSSRSVNQVTRRWRRLVRLARPAQNDPSRNQLIGIQQHDWRRVVR